MNSWGGIFDAQKLQARLEELNIQAEDPTLWDKREKAETLLKERTRVSTSLATLAKHSADLEDIITLSELADAENDAASALEAEAMLGILEKAVKTQRIECLFAGPADGNDCFLEIHAGAGGTESCDWAEMLLRMYMRWAEAHKFTFELVQEQKGDEAGIKSATIKICGHNAYGWAKTESGVHRLVRISPFDSAARRHTSFASAWVYPVVDQSIEINIDEKDLRIDTFRASGAGGQHVNKTDSAIRITHIPTNIVVQCQSSRSQHKNRAEAYDMLRARLYELELRKQEEAKDAANATKTDIGWGHQIRSYVLHPYQMIKDLRTGHETSNTGGVLDGDLDGFIMESLSQRVTGERG